MRIYVLDINQASIQEVQQLIQQSPQHSIVGASPTLGIGLPQIGATQANAIIVGNALTDTPSVQAIQSIKQMMPQMLVVVYLTPDQASMKLMYQQIGIPAQHILVKGEFQQFDLVNILNAGEVPAPAFGALGQVPFNAAPTMAQQAPFNANPMMGAQTTPSIGQEAQYQEFNLNQNQPKVEAPSPVSATSSSIARIKQMVITINSPKGGVGKTSLAKELASALAVQKMQIAPGKFDQLKVCLVDLDLDYGNIGAVFRLNHLPNIRNWTEDIEERLARDEKADLFYSPTEFMKFIQKHNETGLHILAAPINPAQAISVTEKVTETIIDSLKAYYDIVILDTGNNTRDYTLVALDKAQEVILITKPEVPTIRNVQAFVETMEQIGQPLDKLNLVISGVSSRSEIEPKTIVDSLKLKKFLGTIPEDPKVVTANNEGQVLVTGRDSEYTNSIRKITHQLVPVFNTKRKSSASPANIGKKFDFLKFFRK